MTNIEIGITLGKPDFQRLLKSGTTDVPELALPPREIVSAKPTEIVLFLPIRDLLVESPLVPAKEIPQDPSEYALEKYAAQEPYELATIRPTAAEPKPEDRRKKEFNVAFLDRDPEKVAQEIARTEELVRANASEANLTPGGIALASENEIKQLASPLNREPTRGEEQRVIIFNRLFTKLARWDTQKRSGQEMPRYTVDVRNDGNGKTTVEQHQVGEHLIFAMWLATKSMYREEIAHSPTKPLAEIVKEHPFDEDAIEKELIRRRLKLEENKRPPQSITEESQTDDHPAQKTTLQITKEAVKQLPPVEETEEKNFEAWVKAVMAETESLLPKFDRQPSKEAAKYVQELMDRTL